MLTEGNLARGLGNNVTWVAVVEHQTSGQLCLEPTVPADPHKLAFAWISGTHEGTVSLRRLLKEKGIKIPRRHSMVIPCGRLELPNGPSLKLKLEERRFEPRSAHQAPAPAPPPPPSPEGEAAAGKME